MKRDYLGKTRLVREGCGNVLADNGEWKGMTIMRERKEMVIIEKKERRKITNEGRRKNHMILSRNEKYILNEKL